MRAIVIAEPGNFGLTTVKDPEPSPGEVIVAPRAVGICGTDLHIIDGHFPPASFPLIPGHEFAGEVVELGPGVQDLAVGDRVAVDPSLFCGHCVYCRRQRGNLCQNWGATGDTVNGAFAEYVAVPARNAWRLDAHLSWAAGALVEPLACVVHGLRRLHMPAGSDLLIVGAGTIGLLLVQAARRSGAAEICVIETEEPRRSLALALGADRAVATSEEALADREIGFEYAIEATGVLAAGHVALSSLARGGTMLVFGVAPEEARLSVSPYRVYNDEITILGSMAVLDTFEPALRLMQSGAVAAAQMVTHTFALDHFAEAVAAVRERRGLKIQIG